MNNIFKVIWNHATQTWTAVGELASAKGKSKSVKLAVISTALFSAGVYAAQHTAAEKLIAVSDSSTETTVAQSDIAQTKGNNSIAVGRKAVAGKGGSSGSTAIGYGAKAESDEAISIGSKADITSADPKRINARGIAIGTMARVDATRDNSATNSSQDSLAMGTRSWASGSNAVVIGKDAKSLRNPDSILYQSGTDSVAIGSNTSSDWARGVAIGLNAKTNIGDSVVIGSNATSSGRLGSVTIGAESHSYGANSVALGVFNTSYGSDSVALGKKSNSYGDNSIAVGKETYANKVNSIALGVSATIGWDGDNAMALGNSAHAANKGSNAFGIGAFAGGERSTAVGQNAITYGVNTLALGSSVPTNSKGSMAIGDNSSAIGPLARAIGINNIAFGHDAKAGINKDERATLESAYNTYKEAYDTYATLDKKVIDAKTKNDIDKLAVSSGVINFKALITKYSQNEKVKSALKLKGIEFSELEAMAQKISATAPTALDGVDVNVPEAIKGQELIKKIAALQNTGVNEENEYLAYLVALAQNLSPKIESVEKSNEALATAETNKANGLTAYSEAEKNFKKAYENMKQDIVSIGTLATARSRNSVALGREAEVSENNSDNALASGYKAKVYGTSPNAVAIGSGARAGENEKWNGKAVYSNASNATAIGASSLAARENATAVGYSNLVRAENAGAFGTGNIVGELNWKASEDNQEITSKNGSRSFVVGSNNTVKANNAMVFGNNVTVSSTQSDNRDNAVVLGERSDGAPTVKKVNSANVNGMVYSGFKGNLGSTKTDGSEAEKADKELQGRFVSVGSATKEENGKKVYGERQIKHVAAGEISSTSTDAINGSQLYAVASGLRDAFPVVYTDAAGNKVVKYPDGNYYPEGTVNINNKYYPAGTTANNVADAKEAQPVADVIASMNNPTNKEAGKAGNNVTLTNVAPGAKTFAPDRDKDGNPLVKVGDKYYKADQLKADGQPKENAKESTKVDSPVENAKTDLADLDNSVSSNALTVADAKNLGWVVSADSEDGKGYAAQVTNAKEVRFNGKNGIKVTGKTDENGIRNINIEMEKSDVVKEGEYKIDNKTYVNIDGKLYDKDDIDPKTGKEKPNTKPSDYTVDNKGNVTNTAKPTETVAVDKGDNFVNGNTVYKAIQESGWTVGKAKDALANNTFKDKDEKVNPNDEVRFADGKGITVKTATVDKIDAKGDKQTTTVVKFDTDLPIDYANVKNAAGDTLKQANDGNWYKEADVNNDGTVKLTNNKAPEVQKPVKTGATLSDANSNVGKNPYRTAIEDKAMAAALEKVKAENPNATAEELLPKALEEAAKQVAELEKAEKTGKDKDVITAGKGGVQLNNVGWAENPDQAVNKDQLDQTVNKSGFFVQQNGKTTVEDATNKGETDPAKSEKVTPNDVVNFVNGNGTVIKAVTKRDANGVDTTTVSVDVDTSKLNVPKGANIIAYNDKGEQIVKVDDKYYKPSDLTNGKPNTDAVEQKPATPATDKPVDQAKNGLVDLANSNAGNTMTVKDAQNLGWVVSTSDNNKAAPVKNADVVDFKAEPNTGITVKGDVKDGKMTVTVGNDYFKANATGEAAKATGPNSVAIGGNSNAAVEDAVAIGNGAAVKPEAAKGSVAIGAGAKAGKAHTGAYSLDPSATVAGQPSDATRVVSVGSEGNEAQIQNVAAGVVSEKSTDAVNGSQLHATNVQVNKNAQNINRVEGKVDNLSQVINNHAGEFNRLDRKVNKYGKEARAGIAGANAAAALPQVYTPGKSMVAAAAGTFKGQNALAVGYSRASDNGKVIFKLQGNANTSGDVGAGVGVGYQW